MDDGEEDAEPIVEHQFDPTGGLAKQRHQHSLGHISDGSGLLMQRLVDHQYTGCRLTPTWSPWQKLWCYSPSTCGLHSWSRAQTWQPRQLPLLA